MFWSRGNPRDSGSNAGVAASRSAKERVTSDVVPAQETQVCGKSWSLETQGIRQSGRGYKDILVGFGRGVEMYVTGRSGNTGRARSREKILWCWAKVDCCVARKIMMSMAGDDTKRDIGVALGLQT